MHLVHRVTSEIVFQPSCSTSALVTDIVSLYPKKKERGSEEKWLMNGRVAEEQTEERKEVRRGRRAANLIGTVTKTKEALETKAEAKARAKLDIASIAESRDPSE